MRHLVTALLSLAFTASCGRSSSSPAADGPAPSGPGGAVVTGPGLGPTPELPPPDTSRQVAQYSRLVPWPDGRTPVAPPGFAVSRFADGLVRPRWIYVLPNGDVLVAESASSGAGRDTLLSPAELAARWASGNRGHVAQSHRAAARRRSRRTRGAGDDAALGTEAAGRHGVPRRLALRGQHRRAGAVPLPPGRHDHPGAAAAGAGAARRRIQQPLDPQRRGERRGHQAVRHGRIGDQRRYRGGRREGRAPGRGAGAESRRQRDAGLRLGTAQSAGHGLGARTATRCGPW